VRIAAGNVAGCTEQRAMDEVVEERDKYMGIKKKYVHYVEHEEDRRKTG